MKKIEVKGRVLEYEVHSNGSEFDTWYWTDFYEGTVTITEKKGVIFFRKTFTKTVPKRIFRVNFDIESVFYTKDQIMNAIESSMELVERKKTA